MNWANIESQAKKLAIANDTNIWMTKFSNANVHSPPEEITNYIGIETYNINTKYVITPHRGMTTIFNSNNVDTQDQILPTHEFDSLLQKMNIEQHFIFDDVMFRKKQEFCQQPYFLSTHSKFQTL
jgi:hypothetical protein